MKRLFLLGAGASVEAEVPHTHDMTRKFLERFDSVPAHQRQSSILRFVISGLVFRQGVQGQDPFSGVNVEDLFNAIETLANREKSVMTPFVASWHPLLVELGADEINSWSPYSFVKAIFEPIEELFSRLQNGIHFNRPISAPFTESRVKRELLDLVSRARGTNSERNLTRVNDLMIQSLRDLVVVKDEARVQYLGNFVEFAHNHSSVIATLNYDNTIELAARTKGIPLTTGIEDWSKNKDFKQTDGLLLLKLHGSIDWALVDGQTSEAKPIPFLEIRQASEDEMAQFRFRPAVIFGGSNKLTVDGPYLDLLRAFERELSASDHLVVIGYSFGDVHINKYISDWFNSKQETHITIIDPYFQTLTSDLVNRFRQQTEFGRVSIIERPASDGIVELIQGSETKSG